MFGCLHLKDVCNTSRCKTSHLDANCLHPLVRWKRPYPVTQLRASVVARVQGTNQPNYVQVQPKKDDVAGARILCEYVFGTNLVKFNSLFKNFKKSKI